MYRGKGKITVTSSSARVRMHGVGRSIHGRATRKDEALGRKGLQAHKKKLRLFLKLHAFGYGVHYVQLVPEPPEYFREFIGTGELGVEFAVGGGGGVDKINVGIVDGEVPMMR
ncbi:hypothetical protein C8F04DRAFT_1189237 [Mycena alexandri]|uniref:Uncharacterized protein n=1 Tax=Mycena alexandri TaxID=1745969 RepID=A0AAD6SGY6_9AGAR|nr:hypothetical protein C8F04DRAFT_1189237 [Mycena alexandri]